MKAKKGIRTYRQAAVNAVILVIILGMFLYLGIQFSQNFSTAVSTQRTQIYTDSRYLSFSGYIFRDEAVSEYSSRGIIDYLVADGERVGVNKQYAVFYPTEHLSDTEIAEKQAHINELTARISRLRSGLSGAGYVSDLAHINETLSSTYYSYINSILGGDFSSAEQKGDILVGALVDYTTVTGRDGVAEDVARSLEKEKKALLEGLGVSGTPLFSNEGFYLFYGNDGYESIFNSARLEGLSPKDLEEIIHTDPEKYQSEAVGKSVVSPKWYLTIPCNEVSCLEFTEGNTYDVTFSSGKGESIKMLLEKTVLDDNGEAYLLFSSFDLAFSGNLSRMQDVKILMSSVTGYRIPAEALTKLNGNDGVYILVGTAVEFRRVTKLSDGNGYFIVNTYEKDREENQLGGTANSGSEIPYLNVNDLIITSGNDLYDGKLID